MQISLTPRQTLLHEDTREIAGVAMEDAMETADVAEDITTTILGEDRIATILAVEYRRRESTNLSSVRMERLGMLH